MNVEITSLETRPDEYCACFCVTFPGGAEYRVGGQIPLADGEGCTSEEIAKLCWEKALPLVERFEAALAEQPAAPKKEDVSLEKLPEEIDLGDGITATKPVVEVAEELPVEDVLV